MDRYYEHISTQIKGMISSTYLDLYDFNFDFNLFIEYLEKNYSILQSNFDYHIFYDKDQTANKDYSHYITLDNGIFVDIKTCAKTEINVDVIDMDGTIIHTIVAYSSQDNNKKLINFMNVVNTFVTKNKEGKDNVK